MYYYDYKAFYLKDDVLFYYDISLDEIVKCDVTGVNKDKLEKIYEIVADYRIDIFDNYAVDVNKNGVVDLIDIFA